MLAIISITLRHAALFISGFYSAKLYRDSVPLGSNDNDKTHFLSFPVDSTLLLGNPPTSAPSIAPL